MPLHRRMLFMRSLCQADQKFKSSSRCKPHTVIREHIIFQTTKTSPTLSEKIQTFENDVDKSASELHKYQASTELVAVVDVGHMLLLTVFAFKTGPNAVTVVGNSFAKPTFVSLEHASKIVKHGDFLIGTVHRLKPFFFSECQDGVVCNVKNLEEERKHLDAVENHRKDPHLFRSPGAPKSMYYMADVRALSKQEKRKVANFCRDMDTVDEKTVR